MSGINEKSMASRLIRTQDSMDREKHCACSCDKCCGGCQNRCLCVSETEFALILNYIRENFSFEEQKRLIKTAGLHLDLLKAFSAELSEKLEGKISLGELLYMDRYKLPFPCLFFNEQDLSCSIYKVRPLICRAYGLCRSEGTNPREGDGIFDALTEGDFSGGLVSFLFLKTPRGIIIRRPAPLFYYFSLIFGRSGYSELPEVDFCHDLLFLDEEEYKSKLITVLGSIESE